jgi:hypothetical protein
VGRCPPPGLASIQIVQTASARTVTDYFLQAPERYFEIFDRDRISPALRRKLLGKAGAVIDNQNGYLSVRSTIEWCYYELAIFRRARGAHLVAVNLACTVGDRLKILDPDRNWQDVTAAVLPLPMPAGENMTIRLPRQGRTIEFLDENNRPTATARFANGKFLVKKMLTN